MARSKQNENLVPRSAVGSSESSEESAGALSTVDVGEAVLYGGASAAMVVPPSAIEPAPVVARVGNRSIAVPEYVPLANGVVRLGPKEFVDVLLTDVTDATRQVEHAGRIVIQIL